MTKAPNKIASKPKGPKRIAKVGNGYLCPREMQVINIKVFRNKQAKGPKRIAKICNGYFCPREIYINGPFGLLASEDVF
jgi:hypothetical protein